jgi:hypothetical protein
VRTIGAHAKVNCSANGAGSWNFIKALSRWLFSMKLMNKI